MTLNGRGDDTTVVKMSGGLTGWGLTG